MNVAKLRKDFPILQKKIKGKPFIYLDSAATSHKPQQVIDATVDFYSNHNANIYRGVYTAGESATQMYEDARAGIANFIGADKEELVFTKGSTEGINIIAHSWAAQNVQPGDEIVVTEQEHHSNLLPWQELMRKQGVALKAIPANFDGTLALKSLEILLTERTKLVCVAHVSNAVGVQNDIQKIIHAAHAVGAKVLVDASQSVPHKKINVKELDCDFLVFSGHKMLGPTGIGGLFIKKELHKKMVPFLVGGGMITNAQLTSCSWQQVPYMFEAGTPPIAQAIGLHAAVKYLQQHVDFEQLRMHEAQLCAQFIVGLQKIENIAILGPIEELTKSGHVVSFIVDGVHPHDVAAYLDTFGIAVRAGHHCAQPLGKKMGVAASVRASFYLYNTKEEVAMCIAALQKMKF